MNEPAGEEGDFLQAIERFTEAITLDHSNHTLFSNRSAAYARVGKFSEALKDAQRCHELKRDWPKVWPWLENVRCGRALFDLVVEGSFEVDTVSFVSVCSNVWTCSLLLSVLCDIGSDVHRTGNTS